MSISQAERYNPKVTQNRRGPDTALSQPASWILMLMLLILFAFFYLAKLVQRGVEKALLSSKVRVSHLLKRMIVSTAKIMASSLWMPLLYTLWLQATLGSLDFSWTGNKPPENRTKISFL